MKQPCRCFLGLLLACTLVFAGQPPSITIRVDNHTSVVSLANPGLAAVAGTRYQLRLQSSQDLYTWSDVGDWDGLATNNAVQLHLDPQRFFRLRGTVEPSGQPADGADVFGYAATYQQELQRIGYLTPTQFANQPVTAHYLERIDFDPRTAKYWDEFNADPAVVNAGETNTSHRRYDFRLNGAELDLFLTNGFVVSQRLGSASFGDLYNRILADDLPVFISADSILHAWHRSYQSLLEETEEMQLEPVLGEILDAMRTQLGQLPAAVRSGPLAESVADADYFLTVADSLLTGQQEPTILGEGDDDVTRTLAAVAALQYVDSFPIFGTNRIVDFSQFKVRGHYEHSVGLGRYFQAVMWLERIDFRIWPTTDASDPQSIRELGTSVVLTDLLDAAGKTDRWQGMDDIIRLFVGREDSMTMPQLQELLQAAGLESLSGITNQTQLADLQQRVLAGGYGKQLYAGHAFYTPFGPQQVQLPTSFAFFGQRFVPDGWALEKVTFDRILWSEDIPDVTRDRKVLRRYPSAVDVAYSVLGNQQSRGILAQRMLDTSGIGHFRDGYPYAHNLAAVTTTIDQLDSSAWEDSMYTGWLAALRTLSVPTTDSRFPEAMRTRAWAMRTLNTQLGSYTELKHDTVLYAKQPYASYVICEYPTGFVEPVPAFWQQMAELAQMTARGLDELSVAGGVMVEVIDPWGGPMPEMVDLTKRQQARVAFCQAFANTMTNLAGMAEKELHQEPFTTNDVAFIRQLMKVGSSCAGVRTYDGWYPRLFYKDYGQSVIGASYGNANPGDLDPCIQPDALVTDIFTAVPDAVDPVGGVLHEATGGADLLMIAVDNGPDRMVYAGPVFSYYEFMVPGPEMTRLTDSEWKAMPRPTRPTWTQDYLVPSP